MTKLGKWKTLATFGAATALATGVATALIAAEATDNNTEGGTKKTNTYAGKWWHLWVKNGYAKLNVSNSGVMSADWNLNSPNGNSVLGIGWNEGSTSTGKVTYNVGQFTDGSANGKKNSWISYHGWGRDRNNAIVEYYVTEHWGEWKPSCGGGLGSADDKGLYSITGADGKYEGQYRLYICWKTGPNAYNGDPNQSFKQHYAVRTERRALNQNQGLSFGRHLNAWAAKNANYGLSSLKWQIMSCEGYKSDGKCSLSVWR